MHLVQSDTEDIISGQEEATPTLHREGLSFAVEVPSKARSRVVFGRVTQQTRWPRVVGSCENLPGYPVYKEYRDLC